MSILFMATVPLLGVAAARLLLGIDIPIMTKDVAAVAGIHPLSGFLSFLGILLWWTTATIWFFSTFVGRDRGDTSTFGFMVSSGVLSTYLAFNDLFQFHDYLVSRELNLSEQIVLCGLGFAVAVYLWRYRSVILKPNGLLLLFALGFLSFSVLVDTLLKPWLWRLKDWADLAEEGPKWLGISFWTAFCVVWCWEYLRLRLASEAK